MSQRSDFEQAVRVAQAMWERWDVNLEPLVKAAAQLRIDQLRIDPDHVGRLVAAMTARDMLAVTRRRVEAQHGVFRRALYEAAASAGRLLDVTGSLSLQHLRTLHEGTAEDGLRRDWLLVGQELRDALAAQSPELEEATSA